MAWSFLSIAHQPANNTNQTYANILRNILQSNESTARRAIHKCKQKLYSRIEPTGRSSFALLLYGAHLSHTWHIDAKEKVMHDGKEARWYWIISPRQSWPTMIEHFPSSSSSSSFLPSPLFIHSIGISTIVIVVSISFNVVDEFNSMGIFRTR